MGAIWKQHQPKHGYKVFRLYAGACLVGVVQRGYERVETWRWQVVLHGTDGEAGTPQDAMKACERSFGVWLESAGLVFADSAT